MCCIERGGVEWPAFHHWAIKLKEVETDTRDGCDCQDPFSDTSGIVTSDHKLIEPEAAV